jgi:hypothetical protein
MIALQMGTATTLTVEGAALYAASLATAVATGAQLRVSLVPAGQQTLSPFTEKSRVDHVGETALVLDDDGNRATLFAELWGHNVRSLVDSVLTGRLQRPPTVDELAERLKLAFGPQAGVDARPYLAVLARSDDAVDRALLARLQQR